MHENSIPPCLVVNFDHTGLHFMQMRGNTWTCVEADGSTSHSSRAGKQKETKQQGLGDKRQATGTVGCSMAEDVLPAQLIVAGTPTSSQALPGLPGNRYVTGVQEWGATYYLGHSVGFQLARAGVRADEGQLARTWLGHLVQTTNHWANIRTSHAILDQLIVPWLLSKKQAIGLSADAACVLLVDCWYGWKDQDKAKTLQNFRDYTRQHYSWLRLLFVPAACTDLVQPADRGMVSWLKAHMRRYYTDTISIAVLKQLQSGIPFSEIKIDTSAPYLKALLATAFAKALSELPSDKVRNCWEPLSAPIREKGLAALHAEAKTQLTRLFPNLASGGMADAPSETELEPYPEITNVDDHADG